MGIALPYLGHGVGLRTVHFPEVLAGQAHVIERIDRIQTRLGRQILIENVSSYLTYVQSAMPEWEFLAEIATRSDCGILLDVNNVFVSAANHGFDALRYIAGVPRDRVGQ